MNKSLKKIGAAVLAAACVMSTAACGGAGGGAPSGSTRIDFMYSGDTAALAMYKLMVDEYNKTQGATDKVYVKALDQAENGYSGTLTSKLPSNSAPDVVAITDEYIKMNAKYLDDMTGKIDQGIIDDIYPLQEERYHYNIKDTTSNQDDPRYGLPVYNDTTVLYYNKTAMETVGVNVISVDEENLDKWNNNEIADAYGNKISDFEDLWDSGANEAIVTVPKKGFFRSINPFIPGEGETAGESWTMPSSAEIMVFNDRIATNWDEIEDIGLLCTKARNSASKTQYGYYTEWWFNYGWSVGGDCLEDMTGNGDWTYAHAGDTPNFIVNEGKTYTGKYTGKVYKAGETLELRDVLNAEKTDTISYYTDSETCFYYTVNGVEATTRQDVLDNEKTEVGGDEALTRLPSIKEAFRRFCFLSGEAGDKGQAGLNVCPYPSVFNQTSSISYFTSGALALLIEQVGNFDYVQKNCKDEWGIARMPIYKEYVDASDPLCDDVKAEGQQACHSLGQAICVTSRSRVKDQAYKFVSWMAGEGQAFLARNGYPSSRISQAETMAENFKYGVNGDLVADALRESRPGDWWYMPTRGWIDNWAKPLNSSVRYGRMSYDEYIYSYIEVSNQALADYKED